MNALSPQVPLITELAIGLARRLTAILGGNEEDAPIPDAVHHIYQSDFFDPCDILVRLGLAKEVLRNGKTLPISPNGEVPFFITFVPEAEIRAQLSNGLPLETPQLETILGEYIGLACNFGPPSAAILSAETGPFFADDEFLLELRALAEEGYVQELDTKWCWTKKIAPIMISERLWVDDGYTSIKAYEDCVLQTLIGLDHTDRHAIKQAAEKNTPLMFYAFMRENFPSLEHSMPKGTGVASPQLSFRFMKTVQTLITVERSLSEH